MALRKIQDGLVRIKKIIVDTVDQWNGRLSDIARKTDKKKEKSQSDIESPRTPDCKTDASESEHSLLQSSESVSSGSPAISKKIRSLDHSDGRIFFM